MTYKTMLTTPFKDDAEFVERIVQEVIRRLLANGVTVSDSSQAAGSAAASRELRLNERLVTLATLRGRLDGVARIVVPRKALVTPAVRDELKDRQIELSRD